MTVTLQINYVVVKNNTVYLLKMTVTLQINYVVVKNNTVYLLKMTVTLQINYVVVKNNTIFVKDDSDSPNKYSETDIIRMVEFFY